MSGGSWDYIYSEIENAAMRLCDEKCEFRRALGKRVHLLAKAMKVIEWVDSGDCEEGDEIEYIKTYLGADCSKMVLQDQICLAKELIAKMQNIIDSNLV